MKTPSTHFLARQMSKRFLMILSGLVLSAASSGAAIVFQDNFEPGVASNAMSLQGSGTTPDVSTYTAANTSTVVNSTLWVRSNQGFGSNRSGLVDESENSGNSFTDPTGTQAYTGRYTSNTGISSASGTIGSLATGQTITVTFSAVTDGLTAGNDIRAALVLYNGGPYNDFRSEYAGTSAVLANLNVADATTPLYQTFQFSYTVGSPVVDNDGAGSGTGTTFNPALLGQDIGIRFYNRSGDAIIDNVTVDITSAGIPEPSAALLGGLGFLLMLRRRRVWPQG